MKYRTSILLVAVAVMFVMASIRPVIKPKSSTPEVQLQPADAVQGCGLLFRVKGGYYNQAGAAVSYHNASGWHNVDLSQANTWIGLSDGDLVDVSRFPNACPLQDVVWGSFQFSHCGIIDATVDLRIGNNIAIKHYEASEFCHCTGEDSYGQLTMTSQNYGICWE